ncbi:Hypothetical protein PENO1_027860 [Penicillium occitanis (nom. inval.)]|nr:hypothetical protein PENOC_105070 [Penicillium occitanis (nom. inval.)]PCH04337.1 Hypothetical protein PENO1_027860 [Penicillium occitanis (nom. inval.)]
MAQPSKTRIFMTGASGYVGSVITEFAIAQGYEVHGLSRTDTNDAKLKALGAVPVRGDLESLDVLRRESANAQIIIHLADAMTRNPDFSAGLRVDAAAVDAICETIHWAKEKGVRVIAIRLAPYVYGRGASGVRLFMQMHARNGEVTCIDDGSARTSTIHVDDAARMYLLAAEKASAGDVFNCTSSTNVTALQLAEAMGSVLNLPVKFLKFDEAVAKFGPFFSKFLSAVNRASSAKAIQTLGWEPRELGILEDIKSGSYQALAKELCKD